MPPIPNIHPGASVSAEKWNVLFEELDRKVDAVMDGHPLLYLDVAAPRSIYGLTPDLNEVTLPLVGSIFSFHGANRHATAGINRPSYNHAFFTHLAATLPVARVDETNQLLQLGSATVADYAAWGLDTSNDIFSLSLEAHRREHTPESTGVPERYWIVGGAGAKWPQHIYAWALAELVFEDYGDTFTLEKHYNKFNFFRINNCQAVPIEVRFRNNADAEVHRVTVPPYSCRCVRRASVDAGYLDGFKYFQRFVPGDYRFVNLGYTGNHLLGPSSFGSEDPFLSMCANNVVNPFLVHDLHALFRNRYQARRCAGWVTDPHVHWDANAVARGVYGEFNDDALLVDAMFSRGLLARLEQSNTDPNDVTLTQFEYRGLATLVADFAAAGITVTLNAAPGTADEGFTIAAATVPGRTTWLVPHSSNLVSNKVWRLNQARTFYFGNPAGTPPTKGGIAAGPYFEALPPIVHTVTGPAGNVTRSGAMGRIVRWEYQPTWPAEMPSLTTGTVGQFKQACFIDNALTHYDTRTAAMTGWGAQLFSELNLAGGLRRGMLPTRLYRGRNAFLEQENGLQSGEAHPLHCSLRVDDAGPRIRVAARFSWQPFVKVGDAMVSQPFHWPQADLPWFLPARVTRSYDTLVDGGSLAPQITRGTLEPGGHSVWPLAYRVGEHFLRLVHPAEKNSYDVTGGDIRIGALRQSTMTIAVQTTVPRPKRGGSDPTAPSVILNGVTPWLLVPDVLHAAFEHYNEPGWWQANKARLEAGQYVDADGVTVVAALGTQLVVTRFLHLPLAVEFYNNMALLVNSVSDVRPLDHTAAKFKIAGAWHAMFPPNGVGPWWNRTFPRTQYAAFYASNETTGRTAEVAPANDSARVVATHLGIPIHTLADLPGVLEVHNAPRRYFKVRYDRLKVYGRARELITSSDGVTTDYMFGDTYLFRVPHAQIETWDPNVTPRNPSPAKTFGSAREFFRVDPTQGDLVRWDWCRADEVRPKLEALGYKFACEQFGVPMSLGVYDLPAPDGEVFASYYASAAVPFHFQVGQGVGVPGLYVFYRSSATPLPEISAAPVGEPARSDYLAGLSPTLYAIGAEVALGTSMDHFTSTPANTAGWRAGEDWLSCGFGWAGASNLEGAHEYDAFKLAPLRSGDEHTAVYSFSPANSNPRLGYVFVDGLTMAYSNLGYAPFPGSLKFPPRAAATQFTMSVPTGNLIIMTQDCDPGLVNSPRLVAGTSSGDRWTPNGRVLVPDEAPSNGSFGFTGGGEILWGQIAAVNHSSPSYPLRSKFILFPTSWFDYEPTDFSSSQANAILRARNGVNAYPLVAREVPDAFASTVLVRDAGTVDALADDDHTAFEVLYYFDPTQPV